MSEVDRLLLGKPTSKTLVSHDDDDIMEDNPVYGCDRTRKPKMMLSFKKANKTTKHIPYPHILMVDETEGLFITIYTTACTVMIEGDKLDLIALRIKRGDCSYIAESNTTAPDGVRVDLIKFDLIQ